MGTVEESVVSAEGTQGKIPPPPGADAGRREPPGPPPPYYPQYGVWYYQPQQGAGSQPRRSGKPKVVGILLVFSGVLSIIMGVFLGAMMYNIVPWMDDWSQSSSGFGEIEGQVIFMNSTPVIGANVTVVDLNLMASTNETGHYRILNIENGWHDLKVEMPGYKTLIKSVYVNLMTTGPSGIPETDKVTTEDFQLQPGTGVQRLGEAHTPGSKSMPMDPNAESILRSMGAFCMVAGIVLGALAVLGGWYALRTEKLAIVALGALCGIISLGFVIGAALAFIALILLLLSTDEFEQAKKEKRATL